MHPESLSIAGFTYTLPHHRIAQYPLEERDASKLLIYQNGQISESVYRQIADHLPPDSLLVFNNTRVVEARLLFQKPSGGTIEVFCLEPEERYPDISTALVQYGRVFWKCLVGGASKWKHGMILEKSFSHSGAITTITAAIVERRADCFIIELKWQAPDLSFGELLHAAGAIPLPPYMQRSAEAADRERYQTIYAEARGSVAAPTAGLHFTPRVFDSLKMKSIDSLFLTLHVGAGTFKPVKAETLGGHDMHAEFIDLEIEAIEQLAGLGSKKIIAVGTTSLRTLESLYWMGYKAHLIPSIAMDELMIGQWEVYEGEKLPISRKVALEALVNRMKKDGMKRLIIRTRILIAPPYRFKIIDGLISNFHQPESTLLLLVAALIGDDWRQVYQYAMDHDFRFLSYGDGCLLWGEQPDL